MTPLVMKEYLGGQGEIVWVNSSGIYGRQIGSQMNFVEDKKVGRHMTRRWGKG